MNEPEQIGRYKVHPMASIFPLMEGEAFEDLVRDIESAGQLVPAVVDGDVLMDGRNRVRACERLKIEPIVTQYKRKESGDDPAVWILSMNLERRHLTPDQRAIIAADADKVLTQLANEARERRLAALKNSPQPLITNVINEPLRDHNASSTRGRLAAATGVSRRKIDEAIAVREHAPELLKPVQRGALPLRKAAKTAHEKKRAKAPSQPKHRARSAKAFDLEKSLRRAVASIERMRDQIPESLRTRFMKDLIRTLEAL